MDCRLSGLYQCRKDFKMIAMDSLMDIQLIGFHVSECRQDYNI